MELREPVNPEIVMLSMSVTKGTGRDNLIVGIHFRERRGVCAENLAAATPVSKRKMNCTLMVDDTKSEILKHEDDEVYRRLQQGFEAFRPAFQ
ncbi:MAG TPA: hypothetical protein VN260_10450 [Dissulfurispiraceae bacterium]|nr:hypothetical protein [Dissulfurispiraceae bacterium]